MVIVDAIKKVAAGKAVFRAPKASHLIHKGEHGFHLAYFAGVFAEGHGFYRYAALALLVLSLAALFVGDVAEEVA